MQRLNLLKSWCNIKLRCIQSSSVIQNRRSKFLFPDMYMLWKIVLAFFGIELLKSIKINTKASEGWCYVGSGGACFCVAWGMVCYGLFLCLPVFIKLPDQPLYYLTLRVFWTKLLNRGKMLLKKNYSLTNYHFESLTGFYFVWLSLWIIIAFFKRYKYA